MAVIGSVMGLPSLAEILSSNLVKGFLLLVLVSGIGALIIDYARVLRLHKKMASQQAYMLRHIC